MSNNINQTGKMQDFVFSDENASLAKSLISRYPEGRQQSAVMPLLDLVQKQDGWVSASAMNYVAVMLGMAPVRVYEVATFYTMFNLKPVGKHNVRICTNLPCMLCGSQEVKDAFRNELGIDVGETTPDGMFTLSEVECLGACVNGPVAWIGDDYYEDLDRDSVKRIIDSLKRGEKPKAGSQSGRQTSAPSGGPTTLTGTAGGDA